MKRGSSDLPERIGERWQIDGKGYLDFDIKKKKKARHLVLLLVLPLTHYPKPSIPDNQSYEISAIIVSPIFLFKEKF